MTDAAKPTERAPIYAEPAARVAAAPAARRPRLLHIGTATVLVVGLVITATLAFGAQNVHNTNEGRLLRQRVKEAGAVISAAVPSISTPLASAALLARTTGGDPHVFSELMTPLIATGRSLISASLWTVTGAQAPVLVTSVGAKPELASESPQAISQMLRQTVAAQTVTINDLLSAPVRRIGYAAAVPGTGTSASYVVYAEAAIPKNRRANVDTNSAFSDLDYALYLGKAPVPSKLVASSTGGAVPSGRRASDAVAFGNSHLLLVMSAKHELDGTLLARLPWGLALVGVLLTLAGAFLVERLVRRRDHAELLAIENDALFKQQRSVAQTLQHSLLPDTLPTVAGVTLSSRYVAGVEGIDIGGDWYDVMLIDDDHVAFVVGDVSGRGLRAATAMAELRYAVRAYAAQGDPPQTVLTKVSRLIDVGRDGHFATALCGSIDIPARRLTLANAGHPNPLLVAAGKAEFIATDIGAPLGVLNDAPYAAVTVAIPSHATVLAFTDGLVERRGETLDVGLARLARAALEGQGSIDDMLTNVLSQTIPSGSADDTAILGMQWRN